MADRYLVTLTADERGDLESLVSTGKTAARRVTHARILLLTDQPPSGPGWPDAQIMEALSVGESTVLRVRRACVLDGLSAAIDRKTHARFKPRKLDGAGEARLVTLACSKAEDGRSRWTIQMLADKLVELNVVDTISEECVRQTLKKTNSSLGFGSNG